MPVIKSAIKKLRRDRKREKVNDDFREKLDRTVRDARKKKTSSQINNAVSLIDKAVKNNLLHKNTAARMKASLSKLARPVKVSNTKTKTASVKPAKKTAGSSKASPAIKKSTK